MTNLRIEEVEKELIARQGSDLGNPYNINLSSSLSPEGGESSSLGDKDVKDLIAVLRRYPLSRINEIDLSGNDRITPFGVELMDDYIRVEGGTPHGLSEVSFLRIPNLTQDNCHGLCGSGTQLKFDFSMEDMVIPSFSDDDEEELNATITTPGGSPAEAVGASTGAGQGQGHTP